MIRIVLLAVLLAACTTGAPESETQRTTAEACREQANTTYNVQNRDQIYRIYDRNTPNSGIGLLDIPTRQLSDSYAQQQMISNCIRNTGTGADRELPGTPTLPTGPSGPSLSR